MPHDSHCYYHASISNFLSEDNDSILGKLTRNHPFSLGESQRNSWIYEIKIIKNELYKLKDGYIIFEYTIPRMGKRVDAVFIYHGIIFPIEFKIGKSDFPRHAINQIIDYALDLQDFHKMSHNALIVPILLSSNARTQNNYCESYIKNNIINVQKSDSSSLYRIIQFILSKNLKHTDINPEEWIYSEYKPTPTIIEAAKELYRNHSVENISRNDATAYNLSRTTQAINKIIEYTKLQHKKSICFITGVPGSGKTLAGLNIAVDRQRTDDNEHAVFLSGNGPLVSVLQEALARDQQREGIKKRSALRKTKEFIQNIHHFRDASLSTTNAPIERVVIFDEAQRAWTQPMLKSFMQQRKGRSSFEMSEPEFLIHTLDRHTDWAVIICLVGGGQEINRGEAGIIEWFTALKNHFPKWEIFISNNISDEEYFLNLPLETFLNGLRYSFISELHLAVSLRSYRSENVASFVKALLDINENTARELYTTLRKTYSISMTRSIQKAKNWIQQHAKGTQRYGIVASSGAKRLKKFGIWVQTKIDAVQWFLNEGNDVRSSCFMEDTATEFDIQGLELDWAIVCWDANLRIGNTGLEFYAFKGSSWTTIKKQEEKNYLKNTYRVLLTRARQGFIIFIPKGDDSDNTRKSSYYDCIFNYLKRIGIEEIGIKGERSQKHNKSKNKDLL